MHGAGCAQIRFNKPRNDTEPKPGARGPTARPPMEKEREKRGRELQRSRPEERGERDYTTDITLSSARPLLLPSRVLFAVPKGRGGSNQQRVCLSLSLHGTTTNHNLPPRNKHSASSPKAVTRREGGIACVSVGTTQRTLSSGFYLLLFCFSALAQTS